MKQRFGFGEYLAFSRLERIGILFLVCLILGVALLPSVIESRTADVQFLPDTAWARGELEKGSREPDNDQPAENPQYDLRVQPAQPRDYILFEFNPNTLDADGWKKLGLRERTIATILNFIAKGGRFREPGDLRKIYGLRSGEAERLEKYVRIPKEEKHYEQGEVKRKERPGFSDQKREPVEINSADTASLISLPGIGSKLALRIVNFRDKLGGFYSIEQVREVYGLSDSNFQKLKPRIKVGKNNLKTININTAPETVLAMHPYIKSKLAKQVINYRKEHGPFLSVDKLQLINSVTPEQFEKLQPYLTIE